MHVKKQVLQEYGQNNKQNMRRERKVGYANMVSNIILLTNYRKEKYERNDE